MTIIRGSSEWGVRAGTDIETLRELHREVIEASDQATTLTRQLLAFSRRDVVQPKALEVSSLVRNIQNMLSRLIGEDIELVIKHDDELAFVWVDPGHLEQVFLNLAVNARDAMTDGGQLSISIDHVDRSDLEVTSDIETIPGQRFVRLTVRDTGSGMSPSVQEQIFEPFFTTKDVQHGTGLGLATVYGIVQRSGGTIRVQSEEGTGTSFEVILPWVEPAEEATEDTQVEVASSPRGNETILVVEDESRIVELLRSNLESVGYKILEARHGVEAISVARGHDGKIDLLMSDVVMPNMGGVELYERLSERDPSLKVIFMSGYSGFSKSGSTSLPAGAIYLQKPFHFSDLPNLVREVLDGE